MSAMLFLNPIIVPRPNAALPKNARQDVSVFTQRAADLLRAAALIQGAEPGLLQPGDLEAARRKGSASARRILKGTYRGKPHVLYYRAIGSKGILSSDEFLQNLADRIWILDDRCGLADAYLRGAADAALQKCAEMILCPNPLRRDRLEAVILPEEKVAYLSEKATSNSFEKKVHFVHLDRIPDAARRQALRSVIRENKAMANALIQRAVYQLANAEILTELESETCAARTNRI